MKENRAIIVSGYFDPIHQGHLDYLHFAKDHGHVYVILNSDRQAQEKKGKSFQDEETRLRILYNMEMVKNVFVSQSEDHTVCNDLVRVTKILRDKGYTEIYFANGGDRAEKLRVPEADTCRFLNVAMLYDTSGKRDSSRRVLEEAGLFCERSWGWWRVLEDFPPTHKVKLLYVEPGQQLSMQRHEKRWEHWFALSGKGEVRLGSNNFDLETGGDVYISRKAWHQLRNVGEKPLRVLEVQYGTECVEEDIERQEDR